MCAQFGIKTNPEMMSGVFGVEVPEDLRSYLDQKILPYKKALVLVSEGNQTSFKPMSFSLVPSWSKAPKVKFATHNARLETIAEKPTWKKPFLNTRCLVPMTYFVEPIYENKYAGNMVRFFDDSQKILVAAGIWDSWVDKESGEVLESFSIITDEPPKFISEIGHDRCPVFLEKTAFSNWLSNDPHSPDELKSILNTSRPPITFGVDKDRAMRPGWEKRV